MLHAYPLSQIHLYRSVTKQWLSSSIIMSQYYIDLQPQRLMQPPSLQDSLLSLPEALQLLSYIWIHLFSFLIKFKIYLRFSLQFSSVRSGPIGTYFLSLILQNCYAMLTCDFHSLGVTGWTGQTMCLSRSLSFLSSEVTRCP
jgi:hypothetical protein